MAQKFKEKQQLQQQRSQADGKKPHKKQLADAGSPTTAATLTTRERAELAEIDAHCTFTPTISRKSREIHASLVRRASSATKTPSSFVERSKVWARRKEEILEAEREAKREGDLRDCTLQPVTCAATSSSPMAVAKTPTPGLESYLARQERARKMREERDAKLNRPTDRRGATRRRCLKNFRSKPRRLRAQGRRARETVRGRAKSAQKSHAATVERERGVRKLAFDY